MPAEERTLTAERDIRAAESDAAAAAERLTTAMAAAGLSPASDASYDAMLANARNLAR